MKHILRKWKLKFSRITDLTEIRLLFFFFFVNYLFLTRLNIHNMLEWEWNEEIARSTVKFALELNPRKKKCIKTFFLLRFIRPHYNTDFIQISPAFKG